MIDRGRRNRRIAAAICISLVINGLQIAGIRRLVSARASTQDVEIAVRLQPRSLTLSLRPRPTHADPAPEPPVTIARTVTAAPLIVGKLTATPPPTRIAAAPPQYRPYPLPDPARSMPNPGYATPAPSAPEALSGSTDGAQPGAAVEDPVAPSGTAAPGHGGLVNEPARSENLAPARRPEVRPLPERMVDEPTPAIVPAVIHGEKRAASAVATPQPLYPSDARAEGVEGESVLSVSLDARASVTAVDVVKSSGDRRLDRAAQRGVRNWQFEPALEDGRPAASVVRVRIRFSLN